MTRFWSFRIFVSCKLLFLKELRMRSKGVEVPNL